MVFVQLKRETWIQGEGGALFFPLNKENSYKNVSCRNILTSHFIYETEKALRACEAKQTWPHLFRYKVALWDGTDQV